MQNQFTKGRPTTKMVSVLDTRNNSIIFTGSIADFVETNFRYCSEKVRKNAKAEMYNSANLGKTAFRGQVRVFNNLEDF